MKTTLDIVTVLYQRLVWAQEQNVLNLSGGAVYKFKRLANRETFCDVVINSLPVTGDQLQEAVANINIHAPNLTVQSGNAQDNSQPDTKTLKELTDAVIGVVDDYWPDEKGNFSVQQQTLLQDQDGQWYSNLRIEYYNPNI